MLKKKESSPSPESIYKEYFDYTRQFQETHGSKTIILMQVGAFYEIYGIKYQDSEEIKGSWISDISEITGLSVSSKKYMYEGGTIMMAGFRDYTLDKYLPILMDNGYAVVEIIQAPDDPAESKTKKKTRIIHAVHSAGTYMPYDETQNKTNPHLTNNIMCCWMDHFSPKNTREANKTEGGERGKIVYGLAVINIYTGESFMFEHETEFWMNPTTFDELERYMSIYSPSEFIFIHNLENKCVNTILQYIKCPLQATVHTLNLRDTESKQIQNAMQCTKQKYIQYILKQFFGEETFEICSEFSYYPYATQAYGYLLNFVQEHNIHYGKRMTLPLFQNTSHKMRLANHTLKQLNIISDSSEDSKKQGHLSSILSFLNKCKTAMGKRMFQDQLTQPVFHVEWLQKEYEMTDFFLQSEQTEMVDCFRKQLGRIRDINKFNRQLLCRKIYPSAIFELYQSLLVGQQITECLYEIPESVQNYLFHSQQNTTNQNITIQECFQKLIQHIQNRFKLENCENCNTISNFSENIICSGKSLELDNSIAEYEKVKTKFYSIHQYFMSLMQQNVVNKKEDDIEYIKINETDKNGLSMYITKTRGDVLLKILQNKSSSSSQPNESKDIQIPIILSNQKTEYISFVAKEVKIVNANKSYSEIEFPLLTQICHKMNSLKQNIQKQTAEVYMDLLGELEEYYDALEIVSKYLCKLDVILNKAYLAKQYRYCRPTIDETSPKSFVDAKDLRHVLIENLQQNEIYVPNNISLGMEATPDGILLFGTNAVGKTSLIRALGISLIMAQSGIYVPCSKFVYKPYTAIYSRILSNDNLFKGLSTFAVEISELRVILLNADENSFIVGDELCSGTETESALGIFMSSLQHLHQQKSSFIFATHFHEIADYDELKSLTKIQCKHLSVWYDRELDRLVYDRKMKDGLGNRMYGLEVCKSLYLPQHIIEYAYEIRRKYSPEYEGALSHTVSHYNSKKIKGRCEVCGEKMGDEIHHLQPQCEADVDGYLQNGWVHKNHPANLMSVCERCHDEIHSVSSCSELSSSIQKTPHKKITRKKTTKGYTFI